MMDIQGIEELANAANAISPMRDELKDTRPKFEDLCLRMNIDEATSLRAWDYIAHLPNSEIFDNPRYIAGSRRFSSLVSSDSTSAGIGSLSQLLRQSNIRLVDFFEPLKAFIALLQLGKPYEEQLKQVEKNFVVMCILFQKYEKMFDSLFHVGVDHVQERGKRKGSLEQGIKTLGWNLFLICKGKLLQDPPDLVQAFHLLLCCVNLLVIHIPPHMRKVSFRDSHFAVHRAGDTEAPQINTLKYLCKSNNALEEEVAIMDKNFLGYIRNLCSKKTLRYQPGPVPQDTLLHNIHLGGFLDSYLARNLQNINQEYDLQHYNSGDLDERLFLENSDQIGTPSRLSSQSRTYHNYRPPNTDWEKSAVASPFKAAATPPHHPPQTPLTAAMSTLSWLKATLHERDDQPSTTLRRFFRAANPDPSITVETRVRDMSAKLQQKVAEVYTNNTPATTSRPATLHQSAESSQGSEAGPNNSQEASQSSQQNSQESDAPQQHSQGSDGYDAGPSQNSQGFEPNSQASSQGSPNHTPEVTASPESDKTNGTNGAGTANQEPTNIIRSNSSFSDIVSEVDTYMNIDEFSDEDKENNNNKTNTNNDYGNAKNNDTPTSSTPTTTSQSTSTRNRWMDEWEHRKTLIIKLYYKVLESMLLAEEARLHTDNFSTLLGHESFHRSLFACSAEIVLYAYKMMDLAFPCVLRVFELSPFDFCKLIENVVRLESGLPRVMVRHLGKIEEQILESLAWEEGSPVYSLLQAQQQPSVRSTPKKTSMPPPSLAFGSPVKGVKGAVPSTPSKGVSLSLELFMRKVELLFTIRGQSLCATLQLPSAIFQQLWRTLVHILAQEPALLKNRHIDQILMCALYGVCRANKINVTFKSIIEKYSTQPQASSRIYREVVINQADNVKSDIISFYNTVFIPATQAFLISAATEPSQTPAPAAPSTPAKTSDSKPEGTPSFTRNLPGMVPGFSPMRAARSPMPHHNIYVSPMSSRTAPRTHTIPHHPLQPVTVHQSSSHAVNLLSNTPKTVLFNFGGAQAQELRQINESINSPAPTTQSPHPPPPPSTPTGSAGIARRAKRQLFDSEAQGSSTTSQSTPTTEAENHPPPKRRILEESVNSESSSSPVNYSET